MVELKKYFDGLQAKIGETSAATRCRNPGISFQGLQMEIQTYWQRRKNSSHTDALSNIGIPLASSISAGSWIEITMMASRSTITMKVSCSSYNNTADFLS